MSCERHPNKMAFPDRRTALSHIKITTSGKIRPSKVKLSAYECDCCSQWHLTSQSKSQRRRIRKINRASD